MLDDRLSEAKQQYGWAASPTSWRSAGRGSSVPNGRTSRSHRSTGVKKETLQLIGEKLSTLHPDGKQFFSKLEKILNDRKRMMADGRARLGHG
jgi:hypothetical protein